MIGLYVKAELSTKTAKSKELQTELVRLNAAYNRRAEKIKTKLELQQKQQKEEQTLALNKQSEFLNRVTEDVRQLQEKHSALTNKLNLCESLGPDAVAAAREEGNRRRARAKRQWEQDEKQHFEKLAHSKQESMRKAAADSLGPKLERMVIEGREEVRAKEENAQSLLRELRKTLQADLEAKVSEAAEALSRTLALEEDRDVRQQERRSAERLRVKQQEIDGLREQAARDKKAMEEAAERARRVELEASLDARR